MCRGYNTLSFFLNKKPNVKGLPQHALAFAAAASWACTAATASAPLGGCAGHRLRVLLVALASRADALE